MAKKENKRRKHLKHLLVLSIISSSILNSIPSFAVSEDTASIESRLNEFATPQAPVFGKVDADASIMAGVSLYRYVPEKMYLEGATSKEIANEEKISLLPKTKEEVMENLDDKRQEIQKAQMEGLNFIQPSLSLTPEEQSAIDEFFTRNEQEQLISLWQSTIERNKTIQYIIQRLAPEGSAQEKRTALSQTLATAVFIPLYALQAFANNGAAQYGVNLGTRALGTILQGKFSKDETKMQLSQTESIVLFMLIDEVAERLRQRYHSYKKVMVERALATSELEAAKQDSLEALSIKSSEAPQLLANIQRRAVEREIRRLDSESRYYKNSLVELAGPEAVTNLENQLTVELAATTNTPLDWRAN